MQKVKKTATLLALLLMAVTANAYDFSAVAPSGQTLYYKIVTGGVMLTYPATTDYPTQGWYGFTTPTGALTIPSSVVHGGTTYAVVAVGQFAFYQCTGLTQVTVPEGVTAVRASAFRGCSALDSVSLPSTLDSLGTVALGYCPSLSALRLGCTVPPVCASSTFSNDSLGAVALYVPCGYTADYLAVTPWSQFGSISDDGCNVTLTVDVNYSQRGSVSGGGTFPSGTNVVLNATPAAGFFFVCWNDGDTLNPRIVTATADRNYTAFFFALQHDTVYTGVIDTVEVNIIDTVYPDFAHITVESNNPSLGICAGNSTVPVGTLIEIAAIPLEGGRFISWNDGSAENPHPVQVNEDITYYATFGLQSGIDVAGSTWSASVDDDVLTVCSKVGERLRLYDIQGRCLMSVTTTAATTTLRLPSQGVYLVQMGDGPARKIEY